MPKYYYVARNRSGAKETGTEEALTQEEAINKIQQKGLLVISVIPANIDSAVTTAAGSVIRLKFKARHGMVTSADLTLFCRQLATLLGSGVTILKSLEIISEQVSSKKLYSVILELQKSMEAGLSFHEALTVHPRVFSDLWVNLVESGEASGNLAVILSRLATYLEKDAAFRRKVISALIYPAILTVAGVGALFFMAIKIVPTFAHTLKGFDIELPLLTRILVIISDFLRRYLLILILGFAAAFYALKQYIHTVAGRRSYERLKFKLPIFGEFFQALVIERFSSGMATLLESGVPILYSLEISERSVNNLVMADVIRSIKEDLRGGRPLKEPLQKSGFFEPMVVQMISIGEEIGELPQMFKKINDFYQEYCETFLTRIISMFEPFILVFIGSIIGIMVIGMFLPIFQIAKIG